MARPRWRRPRNARRCYVLGSLTYLPSISVAIPAYNGARHIREQLESLATQSLLPRELVVCDDCSSDGTLVIIREFAARAPFPVRVIQNDRHLGCTATWLRAARCADGELIAGCDQDDAWEPERLLRCAQRFGDPEVMLAVHAVAIMDEDGVALPGSNGVDVSTTRKIAPERVLPKPAGGHAMVYRSRLLDYLPLDADAMSRCGFPDEWVWLAACAVGPVAFIPEPLTRYRRHAGNISEGVFPWMLRARIRRATGTGGPELFNAAVNHSTRASAIRRLLPAAELQLRPYLDRWAADHLRRSRFMARRAAMCSTALTRVQRLRLWFAFQNGGGYADAADFGGGDLSAVRDLIRVALT